MSGLFSHPPAAAGDSSGRPELLVTVAVPAPADHAWAGLTEHLHLWWPADQLSRWGEDSFFDLEDKALVETSAQDDENVWGEVTDGRPGQWLELRWTHAGSSVTTQVRLEMAEAPGASDAQPLSEPSGRHPSGAEGGTTLTLTHGGWTAADPQDVYEFYQAFWPGALARYRRFMGGA